MNPHLVPAEEYALGMMRRTWDAGGNLNIEHIADESGLSRREVEKVRDWALSGKKGAPPWQRDQGRIPPAPPPPKPATTHVAAVAPHQHAGTSTIPMAAVGRDPEAEPAPAAAPPTPPAPPAPMDRWREAKDHPNPTIAHLHDAVLAAIGAVEDALDLEHDLDLLRVEESSLASQLERVREKIRARQQDAAITQTTPAGGLVCPDPACGRVFSNAHGLSVHRARSHKAG